MTLRVPTHMQNKHRGPCHKMNVSETLIRNVKAAASRRNNDLRVAREEAAAARAARGADTDEEGI